MAGTCATTSLVVAVLQGFLRAANQGTEAELRSFFPERSVHYAQTETMTTDNDVFQVYGVSGGGQPVFLGDNREAVVAYLEAQQRLHQQLVLQSVEIMPYFDAAQVQFHLLRRSDTMPQQEAFGQARVNCAARWIILYAFTVAVAW